MITQTELRDVAKRLFDNKFLFVRKETVDAFAEAFGLTNNKREVCSHNCIWRHGRKRRSRLGYMELFVKGSGSKYLVNNGLISE